MKLPQSDYSPFADQSHNRRKTLNEIGSLYALTGEEKAAILASDDWTASRQACR
jgi:hypothetical protein